ncbi:MAG: superoxide dismutase [Gammaproteobacteria bacterium]|nr:superoxide dismutase [Gammaproteobacteria bacterium]
MSSSAQAATPTGTEIELPALSYALDALQPHISQETLEFHYAKHHQAYVNNLNKLIADTAQEGTSLEDIIKNSEGGVFNNAAQIWNHTFYWNSMTPGSTSASSELTAAIEKSFGSADELKQQFSKAAATLFGSGWTWLVKKSDGSLAIVQTQNADTPITSGETPLLTCDVWEHAYYIDYRNARPAYIEKWWELVNWDFASQNFGS